MTVSYAQYPNGKVFHMYLHDDVKVMLWFSASDFRNQNVDKHLAGRVNKFLHYQDMIHFKRRGLHYYDWGNISSSLNPNGIDQFKMKFGGELKDVYSYFVGNTLWGRILIILRTLYNKACLL